MTESSASNGHKALPASWELSGQVRKRDTTLALRWCGIYLLLGLSAALLHPLIVPALASDITYFGIALFAVVGSFLGIRLNHPHHPGPWVLFGLAQLMMVGAGAAQAASDNSGHFAGNVGLSDALYGLGYVLFLCSLWLLVRGREGEAPRSGLLDSLIVITGLILLAWQFLVLPTLSGAEGRLFPQAVRMMYPVMDLVLIGLLVWLRTAPEVRSISYAFLIGGTLIWAASNALFHLTTMSLGEPHALMKSAFLVAHVLWGAAVMHPSMHAIQAPRDAEHINFSQGRIALLLTAALSIPGVIAAQLLLDMPLDVVGVLYAGVVIILLIWLRVRRLLNRLYRQSDRLNTLAQTDFLTGLPNRRQLVRIANERLGEPGAVTALLAIDIDRFKSVNDTFGHHVGDQLICALAERWKSGMEPGDVLARIGGDEFALLLTHLGSKGSAMKRAWRLQALLGEPLELEGLRLSAAASIGVAVSPGAGTDFESVLRHANWAMRAAKKRQSRVELHSHRFNDQDSWRLLLLNEFREAIKRKELILYYQPKLHLRTNLVIGVEALVRWKHPVHGLLRPASFLPSIEQTELIRDLTETVLEQALAQCVEWRRDGLQLNVAINLSARNIPDLRLVESVKQNLARSGLPASSLELEVTESSAMADPAHGLKTLHALEKIGVMLSVDDYGMGHGSLDYLRKLPIRLLKLDRSFVHGMRGNHADLAIVRSTLELARHLRLDVVAEGVEDQDTLDQLRDLGCFAAQGNYLSEPVAAGEVRATIAEIEARLRVSTEPKQADKFYAPQQA